MATTAPPPDTQQLELLEFEDQRVDRIIVKFTGSIELNMNDPDDRRYFDRLRLGKRVAVHATGKVTARPHDLNDAKGIVTTAATITIDALLPDPVVISHAPPADVADFDGLEYDIGTGEVLTPADTDDGFDPDDPGDAPDPEDE